MTILSPKGHSPRDDCPDFKKTGKLLLFIKLGIIYLKKIEDE